MYNMKKLRIIQRKILQNTIMELYNVAHVK